MRHDNIHVNCVVVEKKTGRYGIVLQTSLQTAIETQEDIVLPVFCRVRFSEFSASKTVTSDTLTVIGTLSKEIYNATK